MDFKNLPVKKPPAENVNSFRRINLPAVIMLICLSACQITTNVRPDLKTETSSLHSAISFYRGPLDHLNAVRSGQCPMYPSCSAYGIECIDKHGPIIGWIMTCDRLMRCGRDELKFSSRIYVNGTWRYLDPVDNNDFWWHPPPSVAAVTTTGPDR